MGFHLHCQVHDHQSAKLPRNDGTDRCPEGFKHGYVQIWTSKFLYNLKHFSTQTFFCFFFMCFLSSCSLFFLLLCNYFLCNVSLSLFFFIWLPVLGHFVFLSSHHSLPLRVHYYSFKCKCGAVQIISVKKMTMVNYLRCLFKTGSRTLCSGLVCSPLSPLSFSFCNNFITAVTKI